MSASRTPRISSQREGSRYANAQDYLRPLAQLIAVLVQKSLSPQRFDPRAWPLKTVLMTDHVPKSGDGRRPLDDLIEEITRTLDSIPTILGRLVYLTSLRDGATGIQQESGPADSGQRAEMKSFLSETHEIVFTMWLNLSLRNQAEQLHLYLESLKRDNEAEAKTWLHVAPYLKLVPATTGAADRELYWSDLEMLLELVKDEFTKP